MRRRAKSPALPSSVFAGCHVITLVRARGRMEQAVDARCAERCAALAESVAQCERESSPALCKAQFTRWRTYCVTNSACNPAGRAHDPMRAERRCAGLAKRVASCAASVDGQAASTSDCDEHRRRWRSLCEGVAVHEALPADPEVRCDGPSLSKESFIECG